MLMKLTPGVFCTKFWRQSQKVTRKAAKKDVRTKKACEKTLMKLTAGWIHEQMQRKAEYAGHSKC